MKFFIASDHAGYELKKKILLKYPEIVDLGPSEFVKEDDYPDYVYLLCQEVKKNLSENRGILICMNGGGVCIASNKFKSIRSGLALSEEHAETLISDDNVNVICLGASFISEPEALKVVNTFLNEKFTPENRHLRRLNKLSIIENSNL